VALLLASEKLYDVRLLLSPLHLTGAKHITDFCQRLFGHPEISSIHLDTAGVNRISEEDCRFLTEKSTTEELQRGSVWDGCK
jgi:hypothetical protein